jgi:hypothetical protein
MLRPGLMCVNIGTKHGGTILHVPRAVVRAQGLTILHASLKIVREQGHHFACPR